MPRDTTKKLDPLGMLIDHVERQNGGTACQMAESFGFGAHRKAASFYSQIKYNRRSIPVLYRSRVAQALGISEVALEEHLRLREVCPKAKEISLSATEIQSLARSLPALFSRCLHDDLTLADLLELVWQKKAGL